MAVFLTLALGLAVSFDVEAELDYITDEYTALLRAFGDDLDDPEDER